MEDTRSESVSLQEFITLLSVFAYQVEPERKRRFLFRIYDRDNKQSIPILDIRHVLTQQLFVRTHYSEVGTNVQVKSSYSDRVMRTVMDEVMQRFDRDTNKHIDYGEFQTMVTDADVDLLLSMY